MILAHATNFLELLLVQIVFGIQKQFLDLIVHNFNNLPTCVRPYSSRGLNVYRKQIHATNVY